MPKDAEWIKAPASGFVPERNVVTLTDGREIDYKVLVACPGIKLDWDAIPGLSETIGQNGVTSNYGFDLAPYTNRLVNEFKGGRALFTQPPMPIKCAGAPQKAMYMSCSRWEKAGILKDIDVQFHTAGAVLFGVAAYVPTLMEYVERYDAHLNFESKLVSIDGPNKTATFAQKRGDNVTHVEEKFDMIPPFTVPLFDPQLWQQLAVPALLLSVIGFVESVSVAQTLAAKKRQRINPDQELIGLGAANVAASFTGGYPVTGGFARSVVNFDAGADTPAAGAFTAVGIPVAL